MPQVSIQVFASLRESLGFSQIDIDAQAADVAQLIDLISTKYGPEFRDRLIDPRTKQLRKYYKILVNGRDIELIEGLETPLKERDEIVFFPPAGGG